MSKHATTTAYMIQSKAPGFSGTIDPKELTESPLLARITPVYEALERLREDGKRKAEHAEAMQEHGEDWEAFISDVRERGVIEPVKVIEGTNQICDGRHRRQAAIEAGRDAIPFVVVTPVQAKALMESTLVGRQHLTKGMRAYAAVVLHPEVAMDGKSREKAGKPSAFSAEGLADRFGVSTRLVEQACELYRRFSESKKLQARHEWRVRAGWGLGAILAGLGGEDSHQKGTGGGNKAPQKHNIAAPLKSLATRLGGWSDWSAEDRDVACDFMANTFAEMEDETLEAIEEAILQGRKIKNGEDE